MNKTTTLTRVALRYQALYLDVRREAIPKEAEATLPAMAFVLRLHDNGFCLSEELLHAITIVEPNRLADITDVVNDVLGVNLNWMPLVKGWQVPTGESIVDHLVTLFANVLDGQVNISGTRLPCGHLIPEGTFPLERYNGCPFCGKPFRTAHYVFHGQGSKLKELRLMTDDDLRHVLHTLLTSATPLDATGRESLGQLLSVYGLPDDVDITMKETAMLVVRHLVGQGQDDEAARFLRTPTDILRYLWYEKTGYVQILEPRTLIAHANKLNRHMWGPADRSEEAEAVMRRNLKLKYDRPTCRRVARWMNALPMTADEAAENMNAKRGMWVRMIRALRLAEFARHQGFEPLAKLMDVFYHKDYTTWQGRLDQLRNRHQGTALLAMLCERPGLFARSLFATMLRVGMEATLQAFATVADRLPARLLLSLSGAADSYFDPEATRLARPLPGGMFPLKPHPLLKLYSEDERQAMVRGVEDLFRQSMHRRFTATGTDHKTMYIDPRLMNIPVSVGDRSTTVQDTSCALMGTQFAVAGDAIRLFLQWGKGLHAQPLDMDLSCRIAYGDGHVEECAYYNLTCTGAKHSGDIRSIPEMVGTAEYVELSLPELEAAGARYATFTCNAYSTGALSPNLVVGWMDSAYPMTISEEDGVAYDPSCVSHAVRISESNLSKGLVFGVLDVKARVVTWLEMPFMSQTLRNLNSAVVEALLRRLREKMTVGELLKMKAEAQKMTLVDDERHADECYTYEWALNPAEVSLLLNS